MNRITVGRPLTAQLEDLVVPVEVVDETGRPLGHFVPRSATVPSDECPYSPEETDAMRAESGGRPLAGDMEIPEGEMTFTVIWRRSAEQKLAEIWNEADDRQAIADAADAIDALLRTEPSEVGESRVADIRILTVCPLSVYYDVHENDRLVAVWAVWRNRKR